MKIISYTFEKDYLSKYLNFLRKHYIEDKRINLQIQEVQNQLSKENPFFQFGKIQSFLAESDGLVVGHCTGIIDNRNKETGLIGFYDCVDDDKTANELLRSAINWLKENNCSRIEGPVNANIWHNYRFVTKHKRNAEIFDPFCKDYYYEQWEKTGFAVNGKYVSAIRTEFNELLASTKDAYDGLKNSGFLIRSFDIENSQKDLEILRILANNIFKDSWNFVELSRAEFNSIYEKILPIIDPYFVEIIEKDQQPVGFCFSIINPMNNKQIIMKTIGVLKEYQRMNLGAALLHSQHLKANNKNFNEFYYPLIRVGNNVTKLPYDKYKIITEYSTYELVLVN